MSKKIPAKKEIKNKPSASKKKINPLFFYGLFLFAFSFVLYGQSFKYGYVLDDILVTTNNKFVQQGIEGIPKIFTENTCPLYKRQGSYRPVMLAHLAIEKELWDDSPAINHFFNVFYYALLGVLLFLVLCRLFKNATKLFPFLITLLFMAHPVHTEVVANIKSRDEIYVLVFLLLSILLLFQYIDKAKIGSFIASVFCFFLATLSKENAITYAAVMPLVLYCFTNEKLKRILMLALPYAGAAIVFLAIRITVNHGVIRNTHISPLGNSILAIPSASNQLATKIFVLGKCIALLFLPLHLSWNYAYHQIPDMRWSDFYTITSLLVCTGLVSYALFKLVTRRHSIPAFCILYFFTTISITSNIFVPIGSAMSERFLFLPSLGFCILIIYLLYKVLRIDFSGNSKHNYVFLYSIFSIITLACIIYTINREDVWKNDLALYEAGVKDTPNSARSHTALGNEYSDLALSDTNLFEKSALYQKAENELKTGIAIYHKDFQAWYNLGVVYTETGKQDSGETAYRTAILYNPDFALAWYNLGTSQAQRGDYISSLGNLRKAAALDSDNLQALTNAAEISFHLHLYNEALTYYKRGLQFDPVSKKFTSRINEINDLLARDSATKKQNIRN